MPCRAVLIGFRLGRDYWDHGVAGNKPTVLAPCERAVSHSQRI